MLSRLKKWLEEQIGANQVSRQVPQLNEAQLKQAMLHAQREVQSGHLTPDQARDYVQSHIPKISDVTLPQSRSGWQQVAFPAIGTFTKTFLKLPSDIATLAGTAIKAAPLGRVGDVVGEKIQDFGEKTSRSIESKVASSPFTPLSLPNENPLVVGLSSGLGSLGASVAAASGKGVKIGQKTLIKPTNLAAGMFGVSAGAEQTRGALASGKSDTEALGAGVLGGAAEYGLEKVGIEKFLRPTGKSMLKRIGSRVITEGAQEAAQSLAQSGVSSTYKPVDWRDAFKQATAEGIMGGVVGGVGSVPLDIATRQSGKANITKPTNQQPTRITPPEIRKGAEPIIPKPTADQATEVKPLTKEQVFNEAVKKYIGETEVSGFNRQQTIANLEKKYKLTPKESLNALLTIDNPQIKPINEKVAQYAEEFKKLTDEAYSYYTQDKKIDMGYVENYLPRIYKNPDTGELVSAPEFRLLMQTSGRLKGRTAESVMPEYLVSQNPSELLRRYYDSLDRVAAGREFLKALESGGVVVKSSGGPVSGMRPIYAEGMQPQDGIYYAPSKIANKINHLFENKRPTNIVEQSFSVGAKINSLVQSMVLAGGVPNTPINAFGFMQSIKETMAGHPIRAGKAFMVGMSKAFARKFFDNNAEYVKMMAANDVPVRVNLYEIQKTGIQRIIDTKLDSGTLSALERAWNELTNDATFARFMPALEVTHFREVYKQAINKNIPDTEAQKIAADSVKNFYGKTAASKLATRSQLSKDAATTVFFAPVFRESMVNFWIKNVQALSPNNITKTEYRDNVKFILAAGILYAAMDALQRALTGNAMADNPDNKKDKLIIPARVLQQMGIDTRGKDVGIPYLPSIATVPRNAIGAVYNFATNNPEGTMQNINSFLSMPLKTAGELITNKHSYFTNRPIVREGATPAEAWTQRGVHLITSNMHPWLREGLNVWGQRLSEDKKKLLGIKDKSGAESVLNAAELPFRFYDPSYYKKDGKYINRSEENITIKHGDTYIKIKDLPLGDRYNELYKRKDEINQSILIKNAVEIDNELRDIYEKYKLPPVPIDLEKAKIYANYHKKLIEGKISAIKQPQEEKRMLREIYKTLVSDIAKDFLSLSKSDREAAIANGLIGEQDVREALALEGLLQTAGLYSSRGRKRTARSSGARSAGRGVSRNKTIIIPNIKASLDMPKIKITTNNKPGNIRPIKSRVATIKTPPVKAKKIRLVI